MAVKSLLVRDIKRLSETVNNSINYVDMDYDVKRPDDDPWTTRTRSTVCRNDYAILNAYRLWLQSKRYDYVRAPEFGGLFENNLNDRVYFSEANEEAVKQIVITESNKKWPDIELIDVKVKAIQTFREWQIHIIAKDKGTNMLLLEEDVRVKADDEEIPFQTN